jgi:uncharacterized protein
LTRLASDRAMRLMAQLLQSGRAPAQAMPILAAEAATALSEACAKAGRKDLCPCGSGRKFKRCHAGRRLFHRRDSAAQ